MQKKLLPFLLLIFLVVVWGSAFSLIKVILESIGPLWIMFSRIVLGASVIFLWLVYRKSKFSFQKGFWFWSIILGFLGFTFPFSIIAWGQQHIPSSLTAILMGINPIITLILSYIILDDEKITFLKCLGVISGFLGLVFLVGFNNLEMGNTNSRFLIGQIAVLLGTSSYALASVLTKKVSYITPSKRALGSLLSASIMGLFLAIFIEPLPNFNSLDTNVFFILFILGVVTTGIATVIWFKLVDLEGPIFMSMVNYLIPIWALIIGINLLNETINFTIAIGLVFILNGVWLTQRKKN